MNASALDALNTASPCAASNTAVVPHRRYAVGPTGLESHSPPSIAVFGKQLALPSPAGCAALNTTPTHAVPFTTSALHTASQAAMDTALVPVRTPVGSPSLLEEALKSYPVDR